MVNVEEKIKEKVEANKKNRKIKLITTTQLRVLLSNAVIIKNKIQMGNTNGKDELSEKLQSEIRYLLIKHIYQCGRDGAVKDFDKDVEISNEIKKIGKSAKKFDKFYRYLEEIVAYVKYYVG